MHIPNRLINETSPYLLQHALNPVNWYPWGPDAFAAARERDCPILLSIGYSSCHWCHVMERESFSDPETAALMNRWFVCVKVDREERPDVDAAYMLAVQAMTGHGGWPMTVFLTPEGHPFHAGTYFPPEDRYGMPSFRRVLEAVALAWEQRKELIRSQAADIAADIRRAVRPSQDQSPVVDGVASEAVRRLAQAYDREHGGFYGAPKFPQPMVLDFLIRHASRTGSQTATDMVSGTLDAMARGGIFDHVGGGFHRYSTDREWLVPHFEKMLYDNAQLASMYLHAWRLTDNEEYRLVAERTLDYLRTEMMSPEGGFFSAEDADTDGVEGLFYTWTPQEVEHAVGKDMKREVCSRFGVTALGHLDGRSVLHIPSQATPLPHAGDPALVALRNARATRPRPFRDEKVLVSWNALALKAFAEAAMLTGDSRFRQAALLSGELLLQGFINLDDDGRRLVWHSGLAQTQSSESSDENPSRSITLASIPGFLDDYAFLADALLTLYCAVGDESLIEAAAEIARAMLERFRTDGPFLSFTEERHDALFAQPIPLEDNAIPSGNAVAAEVCLRLAQLPVADAETFEAFASSALRSMAAPMARQPYAFGRWLAATASYLRGITIVWLTGHAEDDAFRHLADTARRMYRPDVLILEPPLSTSAGYRSPDGRPAAFVCRNRTCLPPVFSAEELRALLS